MSRVLRYFFHTLCLIVVMQFTSGCASRGFKLSQQMPGMDNKLNPVYANHGALQSNRYIVQKDGSIVLKDDDGLKDEPSNKRQVASSGESNQSIRVSGLLYDNPTSPVVSSTLDPQNGAVLLGN